MKLALIGASGFVGRRALAEALARGHEVTAIVREPRRLSPQPGLTLRRADIQAQSEVEAAVRGHDAVLSCFHPGGHQPAERPELYRDIVEGTRTMIAAVNATGVQRLLYVGGCGSLFVREGVMLVDDPDALAAGFRHGRPPGTYPEAPSGGVPRLDIPLGARMAFYLFERELELEWAFLSPSRFLGEFAGSSGLRFGGRWLLHDEDGALARLDVGDLAAALLDEAELPSPRGHFTVASVPPPGGWPDQRSPGAS